MSGPFSHEALAAIVGEDLILDAERRAAAAPAPIPESVTALKRICGPAVKHLASHRRPRGAEEVKAA